MSSRRLVKGTKRLLSNAVRTLTTQNQYAVLRGWYYAVRNRFGPPVYVTRENFLDPDFAQEICQEILSSDAWVYTTNDRSQKIKHNEQQQERRDRAAEMLANGEFAYSKYEYPDDSPLLKKVFNYLNRPETLEQVSLLTKDSLTHTTDVFISCFAKGDFLSRHEDYTLGKYAFVLFLNQEWDPLDGGLLTLFLDGGKGIEIPPRYNTLVLFDVYRRIRPHLVSEVTCDRKRIAITGWYN